MPNGKWEIGSKISGALQKSAPKNIEKLHTDSDYEQYKAWTDQISDWFGTHCALELDMLGPKSVRALGRLVLTPRLYSKCDGAGVTGRGRYTDLTEVSWRRFLGQIRERLGCTELNLRMGLASLKQGSMLSSDFAREFEHRAQDANMTEAEAKSAMLQALAPQTLERLDLFI